jgi:hypothetical protein
MSAMHTIRTRAVATTALLAIASVAGAQQPNANVAAFGMAGNYSAAARNFDAVAWNPANLALPGNSVASLNLGGIGGTTGINPVTLQMIGRFNGTTIPAETKDAWLQSIGTGTENGRVQGSVSLIGISIRNIALQVGTSATGEANLDQDAAEVLLYGNAGRTGTVRNYQFAGSNASGAAFTTGAASIGVPLPFMLTGAPDEIITIGVTGKYVVGNAYANAQDNGSSITPSNASIVFPAVYGSDASLGRGVGVDVGLAWHSGSMTAGITVQNLANSFAWDTTTMKARLGTASYNGTTTTSNFAATTYSAAPATLRDAVAAERFRPSIGGGIAWRAAEILMLTADARTQTGDGIAIGPRSQVGAGLDFTGLGFLPVRLGAAKITDGWQAAGGLGLRLGENHFGVSAMIRNRGTARETGAMLNVISFY